MYNIDFLPQLETSRECLFRRGDLDLRVASDETHMKYFPPPSARVVRCHEDINGEWIPDPSIIQIKTDSFK